MNALSMLTDHVAQGLKRRGPDDHTTGARHGEIDLSCHCLRITQGAYDCATLQVAL